MRRSCRQRLNAHNDRRRKRVGGDGSEARSSYRGRGRPRHARGGRRGRGRRKKDTDEASCPDTARLLSMRRMRWGDHIPFWVRWQGDCGTWCQGASASCAARL